MTGMEGMEGTRTMKKMLLNTACRVADTVIRDRPGLAASKWDYSEGLLLSGMEQLSDCTGDNRYLEYETAFFDYFVLPDGTIRGYDLSEMNIDHVNDGKNLFSLWHRTGESRFRTAIRTLAGQLDHQPRTVSGAYWHKKIYPNQIWLDGLFMAEPFQVQYAREFGEAFRFEEAARQFRLAQRFTYEPRSGLYVHACDESRSVFWADAATGRSLNVWGRACGWFGMALVDSLDFIPENRADIREELTGYLNKLMDGVVRYQDLDGVWYQVLDNRRQDNYQEASCTCQFAYTLEKGLRKGYLKDTKYLNTLEKAIQGIFRVFIREKENGTYLIQSCGGAGLGPDKASGRDGSLDYYFQEKIRDNDDKAVGPFLMLAANIADREK